MFRFDNRLRDNEEVGLLISSIRNSSATASVEDRIKACRREIIKWSKEQNLNSAMIIKDNQEKLEEALSADVPDPELIGSITATLEKSYKDEELFWKQRRRILWLHSGDRNTSFFHAVTRGRRTCNRFTVIEDDNGTAFHKENQITHVISQYYQNIFTSQSSGNLSMLNSIPLSCITDETNSKLIKIPSDLEIKEALFAIHASKAPGPDGFSAGFFHSFWPIVGPKMVEEIKHFFILGRFPQRMNETHIRLIPKIVGPKRVADYRLIALCNTYYKIVAKIITKRLQSVLPTLISENQSAFVAGRVITDNVLITHETLHYLKKSKATKRGAMAVKTDMSKAYDRIEWNFLKAVLEKIGFHQKWVGWILECVTTVSYSFLINGAPQGKVIPSRGLRQGDLLSPSLFIMCTEILSGLCQKAQMAGNLPRVRVPRQRVRVPTAGKEIFSKALLSAMPSYSMSCFKLPASLYKQIQSILTRFWWDSKTDVRKMSWVAWSKLTLPKNVGGLGFRDVDAFDDLLLAKIGWRMIRHPNTLLVRFLLGKYCHQSSFLECNPATNCSHGWRSIIAGRTVLETGMGWRIGNGQQISVWSDPWISMDAPQRVMGPVTSQMTTMRVSALLGITSTTWNWNSIRQHLPEYENQIRLLPISSTKRHDARVWLYTKNGEYSSKSGYSILTLKEVSTQHATFNWQSNIWKLKTMPKIRHLLWKAAVEALPVKELLQRKGIQTDSTCKRYGGIESILHVMRDCPFAQEVWRNAPLAQDLSRNQGSVLQFLETARQARTLPPTGLTNTLLFPWLCWFLWTARNIDLFSNLQFSPREVINKSIIEAKVWCAAQDQLKKPQHYPPPSLTLVKKFSWSDLLFRRSMELYITQVWNGQDRILKL